jgi:3-hydroxymyristoyl/3-hydroxydecanoyl-(acyl carrier protein) dehydratase
MNDVPLYSREALMAVLPHRAPFLFVDRVTQLDPACRIVAELDLRPEEPHFAGHFPGWPLMPGVLVAEALAQTSGLLLGLTRQQTDARPPATPPIFYLGAVNLKFTHPARPGETLIMRSEADRQFGGLFRFQVEATCGRDLVASGNLTLAGVDTPSASQPDPGSSRTT